MDRIRKFFVARSMLFPFVVGVVCAVLRPDGLMLLFGLAFASADPVGLAGVVLMTVVTYTLRAWRWGHLLRPLAPVPFRHLISATYVGFMSGLLIPRAGEVVRPYLVARRHRVRVPHG